MTKAYLFNNIITKTTTTVCSTQCILHSIVVNTKAAGTITILDGATGVAILKSNTAEGTYLYDTVINNSLIIVTGEAYDLTVSYALAGS